MDERPALTSVPLVSASFRRETDLKTAKTFSMKALVRYPKLNHQHSLDSKFLHRSQVHFLATHLIR